MTTETETDVDAIREALADLFPQPARHRGWHLANLNLTYNETDFGSETIWSVDVLGPTDITTDWHQMAGHPRVSTVRIMSGTIGTLESPTTDGLMAMVRTVIDDLGLRDLKEPAR